MRPVLAPVLLHALRLLLLLATCGWGPVVAPDLWRHPKELKHLYTSSPRRHFHLQIHPDGRVDGTPFQTVYSAVVLKTVYERYLNIIGVKSRLNLCMDSSGNLFGLPDLTNDCVFKYWLLENHYEVYESPKHHLLVSLGRDKGRYVPRANPPPFSQFLPRDNEIDISKFRPSEAKFIRRYPW